MFISSLFAVTAVGAECPDGDESCRDNEAPPLVILAPTPSPGAAASADAEGAERRDEPPLAIVAPVQSPAVDADDDWATCDDDCDDEEPPEIVVGKENRRRAEFIGQYALQFIGSQPQHQIFGRFHTKRDTYIGAEVRYLPGNDTILWSGRAGAGIDVLGGGPFDLQLGLFVGSAGEYFFRDNRRLIYHSPIAGGEFRFGWEGRKVFTSYRFVGGFGAGPLQRFLSEREFILGYKVTDTVQIFGESVRIDPRSGSTQWSLGLGARVAL